VLPRVEKLETLVVSSYSASARNPLFTQSARALTVNFSESIWRRVQMARTKLIDNPAVLELVEKERAKVAADVEKKMRASLREIMKKVREITDAYVIGARIDDNKDAAGRLRALGGDVISMLREVT
jgi:hypothetical protein